MSECSCKSCVSACQQKPGWFKPGEAERVAEFLKVPLVQLFADSLMADYWYNTGADTPGEEFTFVLSPALMHRESGEVAPFDSRGACVFLKDDRCSIHPVKPYECREWDHSKDSEVERFNEKAATAWRDKVHQQQIAQLLGREPEPPTVMDAMFGALSLIGPLGI